MQGVPSSHPPSSFARAAHRRWRSARNGDSRYELESRAPWKPNRQHHRNSKQLSHTQQAAGDTRTRANPSQRWQRQRPPPARRLAGRTMAHGAPAHRMHTTTGRAVSAPDVPCTPCLPCLPSLSGLPQTRSTGIPRQPHPQPLRPSAPTPWPPAHGQTTQTARSKHRAPHARAAPPSALLARSPSSPLETLFDLLLVPFLPPISLRTRIAHSTHVHHQRTHARTLVRDK